MEVLKRLSASYRRSYWKSGAEMLFPIFFGHMTFASHRCWTVFIKKAVFLAAEAWREEYGTAVRHAAKRDGGETILYKRANMDPYPLPGWRRIRLEGSAGDSDQFEGPNGEICLDLQEAYDTEHARQTAGTEAWASGPGGALEIPTL